LLVLPPPGCRCRKRAAGRAADCPGGGQTDAYQWATKAARLWFCSVCGICTHHQRRSNPNKHGVNAARLDGVNPRDLDPVPWTDGVNHPSGRA